MKINKKWYAPLLALVLCVLLTLPHAAVMPARAEAAGLPALRSEIDSARAVAAWRYSEYSWLTLQVAIADGERAYQNPEASDADIVKAIADIDAARAGLTVDAIDGRLAQLIAGVESMPRGGISDATWSARQSALAAAKACYADAGATLDGLQAAHTALLDAAMASERSAIFDALAKLLDTMPSVHQGQYTTASFERYNKARNAAAEAIRMNNGETEAVLQARYDELMAAYNALAIEPGYTVLLKAILSAKSITRGQYTEESWRTFEAARSYAERSYNRWGLSTESLRAIADALDAARLALTTGSAGGQSANPMAEPADGVADNKPATDKNLSGIRDNTGGLLLPGAGGVLSVPAGGAAMNLSGGRVVIHGGARLTAANGGYILPGGVVVQAKAAEIDLPAGSVLRADETVVVGADGAAVMYQSGLALRLRAGTTVRLDESLPTGFAPLVGMPFTDIPSAAWYQNEASLVYALGLFGGTSANNFTPDARMTRAMLVTVLHRMAGTPAPGKGNAYPDVSADAYYAASAAWADEAGITSDIAGTRFSPDENITREQLTAMLYRFAVQRDIARTTDAADAAFTDAEQIAAYAADAAAWAQGKGIVTGKPGGRFDPDGEATRAEVAAILARFINME